ncbi:MAG TPA: GGDEF domain-containing protein [Silvibacterium sp.]|nr:GGDEF domain-containing protein [Silvibacterium sp.]
MSSETTTRPHASWDQLTGLWNRESLLTLLFSETDRVQRMGTPLGLLLLDIDRFSQINSEYNKEGGDKILKEFSDRIRRFLRSYDLIGRVGGDEFLIALPGCASNEALQLAARIRTVLLRPPFAVGGDMVSITVSMGMVQSRGRSPLVVLREAECALAEAKREGRNCEREYNPPLQKLQLLETPVSRPVPTP